MLVTVPRRLAPLPQVCTRLPAPPDYVLFTYNDYQSGQNTPPYPPGASFLRGIREKDWKIVMYYSPDGAKTAANTVEWVSEACAACGAPPPRYLPSLHSRPPACAPARLPTRTPPHAPACLPTCPPRHMLMPPARPLPAHPVL